MTPADEQAREIAGTLTPTQIAALETLPIPRDAIPHQWIAARPYSSTWRKSSKHWAQLVALKRRGIVESTVSRGETLWRLTKPLGLRVQAALREMQGETK